VEASVDLGDLLERYSDRLVTLVLGKMAAAAAAAAAPSR
jgi:hypothetical protein